MPTATNVTVNCDRCGTMHYNGPPDKRPEHMHWTMWSGLNFSWRVEDLCLPCAKDFIAMCEAFVTGEWPDDADVQDPRPGCGEETP